VTGARERSIVVAGEALIDLVLDDAGALAPHPGGGPFNAARAIGRLEQPVRYLGRLSSDRFGALLRNELLADGVDLGSAVATDDPTTLALAELDAGGGATYRFYFEETSAPGLTPADTEGALDDAAVLYVGTLGLVLEPMASTLEALAGAAPAGVLVALDPNCRPAVIGDPPAYRARLARMLARSDVVKASEDDLAWLAPGSAPAEAARALLAQGPRVALVTLGPAGALVVTGEDVVEVLAPAVEVVDTIGAGDAFGGAFLASWLRRGLTRDELADVATVVETTRFACAVAALTCARAGASPPRLAELTEFSP
jgi:fructokinase